MAGYEDKRGTNNHLCWYDNPSLRSNFEELRYNDFKQLRQLFEEFLFNQVGDEWDGVVNEFPNVLKQCDSIDYESYETAIAYATYHFMDRYHRFQMILDLLWDKKCFNLQKETGYDVLDIGTGPSQTLFALSDFVEEMNMLANKKIYEIRAEYVEQSNGFRMFIHWFVEYAMDEFRKLEYAIATKKRYSVPFHFAKSQDAFDIPFEEERRCFTIKNRYDIVVFNNFLTTIEFVKEFTSSLRKICRYMRNRGLLIVVGASDNNEKYADVYEEIKRIIPTTFDDKCFYGKWEIVVDESFFYNYTDKYGAELRDHKRAVVEFLQNHPSVNNERLSLWESVSPKIQKMLNGIISQTAEKTIEEGWKGIEWKLLVYRKHSHWKGTKTQHGHVVHRNSMKIRK